jgi:two-component system CheB/CheR fusion protein
MTPGDPMLDPGTSRRRLTSWIGAVPYRSLAFDRLRARAFMASRNSSRREASAPAKEETPEKRKRGPKPAESAAAGREKTSPNKGPKNFPVVGVGASAGGLEAFTKLLARLPLHTGMSFVFIQHLDPKHHSMLTDILSRATEMPVKEVKGGMRVEPDNVYVIPPGAQMSLADGSFRLVARSGRGRQTPIDYFLRSLAEQYQAQAVGVVLSGSLSDGVLGLTAIKSEGGITFAQDESSAKFQDMPRAAIAAGVVDFVLPPDQIARELVRIGRHPHVGAARPPTPKSDGSAQDRILALLRAGTGVDFHLYRQSTVRRRISRRMALNKIDRLEDYADFLKKNPGEVQALYDDMLITVTSFFRDPESFEALKKRIFPRILRGWKPDAPIRIWVPGCASGEEVYSTAIALFECFEEKVANPSVQIFATDISDVAIAKSRTGVYSENALADVSPERLRRFFSRVEGGHQISKAIRDVCVFSRQNVTSDPPFSNLDLVSCRNLLIYLEPALQKRVMPRLHYALKPTGYLVLGKTETLGGFADLFVPIDNKNRIFAKKRGSPRQILDFGTRAVSTEPPSAEQPEQTEHTAQREPSNLDLQKEADRLVLNRYAPAGAIIDDGLDVVQFRGHVSPYLEPASGAASFNILKMAREGLAIELRSAVARARKTGAPVRTDALRVRFDGETHRIRLEVLPIRGEPMTGRHYLVLFEPFGSSRGALPARHAPARKGARARGMREDEVVRLEQELTATKEYLQSVIEGQEAANEELKSANEEILSSNEELQSTNEELETAKEELQSVNEELSTINEELQTRNAELAVLQSDLSNLLTAINVPTILLALDGRVRRFSPQAQKLLNLTPSDVGRPLQDLKLKLDVPGLEDVVKLVIDTVATRQIEFQDRDGRWHMLRVLPYWTADKRIDGAVLAFMDIDRIKKSLEEVKKERTYSESLIRTVRESLIILDDQLRVLRVNPAFCETFQISPPEVEDRLLFELSNWRPKADDFMKLVQSARSSTEGFQTAELSISFEKLGRKILLVNARRVELPEEPEGRILLAIEDITDRKTTEARLRTSEERYRQLFESAREGILIVDAGSGALLDANPFLLKLVGYEMDDLLGRALWELPFAADPETMRIGFKELVSNGFAFDPDLLLRSKAGETIHVESISSVYYSGAQKVAQYNMRDITARREAEEQARRQKEFTGIVVDSSLDGIFAFDRSSNLIVWNTAMERIFGVRKEEALGRRAFEVLSFLEEIGEQEYFAEALAGKNVISNDRPYASPGGHRGFFEGHYSPLRDETGRIVGGLATIREITSRKQLEERLRQRQKLESLGTLSGGIAHDFNNILNIVSAYTALLARDDAKKTPAHLGAINKAVDRGAALVRQLLTFARRSDAEFHTLDVNEAVKDLDRLTRETFPKKLEIRVTPAKDLPAASADPNQIHQALLNLCVNARDAMPAGGTLTLTTGLTTGADLRKRFPEARDVPYVFVSVADTGQGIDEAVRARLFEPFFTTKESGQGAGLGLALVYGIVKTHSGFIDVESKPGNGAEFRIFLPVESAKVEKDKPRAREPQEALPADPPQEQTPREGAAGNSGNETILFAEDEEMLSSAVKTLLESEGYRVLTAKDGYDALELFRDRKGEIAISILDLQMPRLSGWETFLKMREIDPGAKVLIASGDLGREERIEMKKSGIEGSIRKPYSAGQVMKAVRRVLDR